MDIQRYNPNRVRVQYSENATGWKILATDGTGYDTYVALLAAGKTTYPGSPAQFPIGIPNMTARSVATGGVTDGSPMQIITNTLDTPTTEDDLISGSGQTLVYTDEAIKNVWVKKSAGTDIAVITGYF